MITDPFALAHDTRVDVGIAAQTGTVPAASPTVENAMHSEHMIRALMTAWDFLPDHEEHRYLLAQCNELVAIDARLTAAACENRSIRQLHRKWRALEDREMVLGQIIDQLERAAGEPFVRLDPPGPGCTVLRNDGEINDWAALRPGRGERRDELKQQLAQKQHDHRVAAEHFGLPAIEAERDRTMTAIEDTLDDIWEFPINGAEELAVFLDIAMGRNEIGVAEPTNPEIVDHVPYFAFIGRTVRAMQALAPEFKFTAFRQLFVDENTANRLLAGDDGTEYHGQSTAPRFGVAAE